MYNVSFNVEMTALRSRTQNPPLPFSLIKFRCIGGLVCFTLMLLNAMVMCKIKAFQLVNFYHMTIPYMLPLGTEKKYFDLESPNSVGSYSS